MESKIDFINGQTRKSLFQMVIPLFVAMVLMMAYNIVDSLWVGNLLGEVSYAALTNSTTLIMILSSIAMGTAGGVSILVSQAVGAKDAKKTEGLIATDIILCIITSIVLIALLEIFLKPILTFLNTPKETFDLAFSYLWIYLLGFITLFLYMHFTSFFRSFGDATFQLKGMLLSTLINVIIDPFFIKWSGLKGAAIATVISEVIGLIFAFIYLSKKNFFKIKISAFDKTLVLPIIKNAVPSAAQQSMPAISATFMIALVSTFSVSSVAAYGITSKLEIIMFYPAMAMNMALTTIIGQCKGANRPDRMKDYTKEAIITGSILMLVLSALIIGFAGPLSRLFIRSEQATVIVKQYLQIVSVGYICYMITSCVTGKLSGKGFPGKSMVLMFFYYIVIRIPLAIILVHTNLALNGVWVAILVSHIISAIVALIVM